MEARLLSNLKSNGITEKSGGPLMIMWSLGDILNCLKYKK